MPGQQRLDPQRVMTGYRGELYDANGVFLAQVNTFSATFDVANTDYQPGGSALKMAIFNSYTLTLTFEETVINDYFLVAVATALQARKQPSFDFQGTLEGIKPDGTTSIGRYIFRSCVPSGATTVFNVKPGEIIARPWTWRCNNEMDIQAALGS